MEKYSKEQLKAKLQQLEDELIINDYYDEVEIGIVGGSSLILKGVESREFTKDIDAIKINSFDENGTKYGDIDELMKRLSLYPLINSQFAMFETVLFVEHENNWELVFEGEKNIIKAYSASNETIVAMKIVALSGPKERTPDKKDINSKYILDNTNPKKVLELLKEYKTYFAPEKFKPILEQYNIWLEEYDKNKNNS